MSEVFISYSRVDRPNAEELARALRSRGRSVWFDADIEVGTPNFAAAVRRELQAARCVVVLWTRTSVQSRWVYAEAAEAQMHRKATVPVVIDGAEPPLPFNVMQGLQVWTERAAGQLQDVVRAVLAALEGGPARAEPEPQRPLRPCDIGGRRFDARADRADDRDRVYLPAPGVLVPVFPLDDKFRAVAALFAASGRVANAGREGACAAFAAASVFHWSQNLRALSSEGRGLRFAAEPVSMQMLWHFACLYEGPGVDELGVGCRSVLAGWYRNGVCAHRLWPFTEEAQRPRGMRRDDDWQRDATQRPLAAYYRVSSRSISDMQFALMSSGALLVSVVAHEGWALSDRGRRPGRAIDHASLPVVAPAPKRGAVGGHAVALVGYNDRGFVVLNSWGSAWGWNGLALLPYDQWLRFGLDAWLLVQGVPIRVHPDAPRKTLRRSR